MGEWMAGQILIEEGYPVVSQKDLHNQPRASGFSLS